MFFTYHIFFYIILVLIIIFLILAAYIKIKFKFWSIQPVFHVYDLHYYFYKYGVILSELPEQNKYCNFKNISTILFSQVNDLKLIQLVNFVKKNYLKNGDNEFIPEKENIVPYFTGHFDSCFFTYYDDDEILYDTKSNNNIVNKKMISCISARPLHVSFNSRSGNNRNNRNNKVLNEINVYYIDYLCVDKLFRKKGIAQQIIQTHEYNQRHQNNKIKVSLFKREDDLTGIVPLCIYDTYCFNMSGWKKPNNLPGGNINIIECGPTNIHIFLDFYKINSIGKFDICIVPELSNIIELIKTKNIFVYMIVQENNVLCCYFFRNSCTNLKKGTMTLSCFASINCCKDNDVFIHGYKVSLWKICEYFEKEKKSSIKIGYCVVENISDNHHIIENLKIKTNPEIISPTAYFFYNYIFRTLPSNHVFIVN